MQDTSSLLPLLIMQRVGNSMNLQNALPPACLIGRPVRVVLIGKIAGIQSRTLLITTCELASLPMLYSIPDVRIRPQSNPSTLHSHSCGSTDANWSMIRKPKTASCSPADAALSLSSRLSYAGCYSTTDMHCGLRFPFVLAWMSSEIAFFSFPFLTISLYKNISHSCLI